MRSQNLLLLLLLLPAIDAQVCPAGEFRVDTTGNYVCELCPAGTAKAVEGGDPCSSCLAGKSQPQTGQSACTDCPAGKFQPSAGSATCADCPAGKSQLQMGSATCDSCVLGRYQSAVGQTLCLQCGPGKSQAATGSTSCDDCPLGKYQVIDGADVCVSKHECSVFEPDTTPSSRDTQAVCDTCPAALPVPRLLEGSPRYHYCAAPSDTTSNSSARAVPTVLPYLLIIAAVMMAVMA